MAGTPKEPQDKRPPARRATKSPGGTSLVEITRPSTAEPVERVPVFSIDGTVYTMPAKVPMTVTLRTLEDISEHGEAVALPTAVRKMLGQEAWDALCNCDYLTEDQLGTIIGKVSDQIIGALEAVSKGK